MPPTAVLHRPDAPADAHDRLSLVGRDAPTEGVSLVSPPALLDDLDQDALGGFAPVGLGMPVVRTPMTPEELQQASWQDRALCSQTDPEAFFPEKGGSTREAKRVCLGCEVRQECLEYALTHDERFGIWGGLSERERRRVKREAV